MSFPTDTVVINVGRALDPMDQPAVQSRPGSRHQPFENERLFDPAVRFIRISTRLIDPRDFAPAGTPVKFEPIVTGEAGLIANFAKETGLVMKPGG